MKFILLFYIFTLTVSISLNSKQKSFFNTKHAPTYSTIPTNQKVGMRATGMLLSYSELKYRTESGTVDAPSAALSNALATDQDTNDIIKNNVIDIDLNWTSIGIDKNDIEYHTNGFYYHEIYEPGECFRVSAGSECLPICDTTEDYSYHKARGGLCSGFLVSPSQFVTAGHCLPLLLPQSHTSNDLCRHSAVVLLDFIQDSPEEKRTFSERDLTQMDIYAAPNITYYKEPAQSVYWIKSCNKHFIHTGLMLGYPARGAAWVDYAVLELDRDVDAVPFLEVQNPRENGQAFFTFSKILHNVTNTAHPMGMIKLFDRDAQIIGVPSQLNFMATIDVERGSSGSAAVDVETGKAIGILINGASDWRLLRIIRNGTSTRCYARAGTDCNLADMSSLNEAQRRQCLHRSSVFASSKLWYDHIDSDPIEFPFLSKSVLRTNGSRIMALQKLLTPITSSVTYSGEWDSAFSQLLVDKVKETLLPDSNSFFGTVISDTYDGSYITPSLISSWLPEIGDVMCKNIPCSSNSILALRELLHNGHPGGSSISLESVTWDSRLTRTVRRHNNLHHYDNRAEVKRPLWRHLFNTPLDRNIASVPKQTLNRLVDAITST